MGSTAIRNRPSSPPSIRDTRDGTGGTDRGKSPSVEELMRDKRLKLAEWRLQRLLSMSLILPAFLILLSDSRPELPDRQPLPPRVASLALEPVALPAAEGMRVTGAWRLTSDDPRVMGLSALAVLADGRLQALGDSGVLVTFARPGGPARALVADLPAGPGYPTFKKYRDSEAMLVEAGGRVRLVAFENQHSLWRFDAAAPARAMRLPGAGWTANKGIEAMVRDPADSALLLLHESGRHLLRAGDSGRLESLPLTGATGGIADAVRLPDGRMMVAVREIGLAGLTNRLAWLERSRAGYRLRNAATLPLGPVDNVEGLAAEKGPDGRTILWAITDNDGWRRTLLLRIDLN